MQSTPSLSHRLWYSPRSIMRSVALRPRVFFGALSGILAILVLPHEMKSSVRGALAWNIGGLVYLALAVRLMSRFSAERIRTRAGRADDSGTVILGLILIAILSSFAAITGLAGEAHDAPVKEKHLYLMLAAVTLVISWLVTQVVFAIHYAHHYYARSAYGTEGLPPLSFPNDEAPDYWDFLYFSTSIGATSQTSDVSIRSKTVRRLVTLHAVVSFFFNTMVLAVTINIAASLV